MHPVKIIIEQHEDGFVGYPLGFKAGAIIGQGDTYERRLQTHGRRLIFLLTTTALKNFGRDSILKAHSWMPFSPKRQLRHEISCWCSARKARRTFERLGFVVVREGNHVIMERTNADGSVTPLVLPNHLHIKGSTLRSICTQTAIQREDFLSAYSHV